MGLTWADLDKVALYDGHIFGISVGALSSYQWHSWERVVVKCKVKQLPPLRTIHGSEGEGERPHYTDIQEPEKHSISLPLEHHCKLCFGYHLPLTSAGRSYFESWARKSVPSAMCWHGFEHSCSFEKSDHLQGKGVKRVLIRLMTSHWMGISTIGKSHQQCTFPSHQQVSRTLGNTEGSKWGPSCSSYQHFTTNVFKPAQSDFQLNCRAKSKALSTMAIFSPRKSHLPCSSKLGRKNKTKPLPSSLCITEMKLVKHNC